MPEISIVIPVFNSAEILPQLCAEIEQHLQQTGYEIILVDDGSKDESWKKIIELKSKYGEKILGVRLTRNYGQHNALVCGFSFAKGSAIITMDDDLQHPPSEIPKLVQKFKETNADVVYGIYQVKQHSAIRNAGGSLARRSSKIAIGNIGLGSSFRMMKKDIADKVSFHKNQAHVFIDEILHWYTSRFATVEVEHHERKTGKSGYTFFRLATIYFDTMINYTAIPLKLMTWIGLLSSLVTFGLGIEFIYRKIVYQVKPGFTAEIVTILFSTSMLMFCMGIIGQYLYKLYHLQSRRPAWSINEVI
jgi:glycosyltransferase involved in cell wall biosynthesis